MEESADALDTKGQPQEGANVGEKLQLKLADIFNGLDDLFLEGEDLILISQIIRRRLAARGPTNKPQAPSLNRLARDIFRVSRQRNEALGASCCPDPEWNMLLDLIIAHTESRPVDVSNLCFASGVPRATALRHIDRMATAGLIARRACNSDKRRIWVEPTAHAINATEALLRQVYEAGVAD